MFRTTFYGTKISDYGRKYGRVDYRTLASTFDAVLCNSILGYRDSWDEWEQVHGVVDNSEEIAEKKEQLEEFEEALNETKEAKANAEGAYDDLVEACENIDELLERFDSFEYEAGELLELMRCRNFETPNGEDLDSDTIEREIESLDFWGMREAIKSHQSIAENERDEAEETFSEAEEEERELTKQIETLTAEIEELQEEDTTEVEVMQWYIISDSGYQILSENTNEIIYYNEELDLYLWGVTHWGTAWDYVLTSIPCETYEQTKERENAEAEEEAEADELEAVEFFDIMDELEEVEEVETEAEEVEAWADASVGAKVKANALASDRYSITKTGWTGVITSVERDAEGNTIRFDAEGYGNGFVEGCNGDGEFFSLEPDYFNIISKGGADSDNDNSL